LKVESAVEETFHFQLSTFNFKLYLKMSDPPFCKYVFVYGTLRRGSTVPQAQILVRMGRFVAPAKVNARLFDLGHYPGMVAPERPGEWVFGDVFEMYDPAKVLALIDEYEGCGAKDAAPCEFERGITEVTLDNAMPSQAWAYWCRKDVSKFRRILSGDFLNPA
jgi:gamma-glutamylcyclotransferase (GGCT)/AIG2-like uncharacterized protein YtfP